MNTHCDYIGVAGKNKGKVCNKFIRKKNEQGKCGQHWKCPHGKHKSKCDPCGGKSHICEHNISIYRCSECGGSSLCEHNIQKHSCRQCCGSAFCEHGKRKSKCRECGGSAFCEHNIQKHTCRECGGGKMFCEHGKQKSKCRECGGSAFCEHNIQKHTCRECWYNTFCEHGKRKSKCRECGGYAFCEHNIQKHTCRVCDFNGCLTSTIRSRIYAGYKLGGFERRVLKPTVYIGCSIEEYIDYLNELLENQKEYSELMTWENHGKYWEIDHIIPLYYNKDELTEEILFKRFHYTNTQPLPRSENRSKGSRFIG